jgi:TetR/AcrR family transcriptional regulator, repressor of fatR-cypB operon
MPVGKKVAPGAKAEQAESPKKEAILQAALDLFTEKGFHGTTVPEVAQKARVGAGTVYRYFESKEALVNALYQHWKAAYGRALLGDLRFNLSPKALFHDLWRRLGSFAIQHPKALAFLELHHHGSYLDEKSLEIERSILVPVRGFVQDSQRRGALKVDCPPEVLMAVVYGAFNGLVRAAANGYLDMTPKLMASASDCVWQAIRG